MKTRLLLFASALFLFWSCEEGLTGTVDSDLESSADVTTTASAASTKAGEYIFSGEMVLDLAENPDVQEYIDQLQGLKFNAAFVELSDVPEGTAVTSATIILPDYAINATFINLQNGTAIAFSPAEVEKLNAASADIIVKKKVRIVYSGLATGEFTFKLKTRFPSTVTFKL